jgi:hypothetical protein
MSVKIAHHKPFPAGTSADPITVCGAKVWMEETYKGLVVETGEHNGYDDSDFFAVVWNGERFTEVTYASTRGWTYANSAEVDAPAELVEKYREQLREERKARELARRKRDVTPGAHVVVVKGRKIPKGTEGVVVWYGPDKYRRGAYRCGVEFEGIPGRTFVAAANLERI